MRRRLLLLVLVFALSGCGATRVGIYARTAPPPIRVEAFGLAPGPGFLWVRGYWGWRANDYYWIPGRWERVPRGRRRWDDGYWERRSDHFYWRDGRWR